MARPADPFTQHGAPALVETRCETSTATSRTSAEAAAPFRAIDLPSASSTVAYEDAAALDLTRK
jgi:hypothetical protein